MKNDQITKNWLEWTVFGIGLLLVLSVVLYLVVSIWQAPGGPPRVTVQLLDPLEHGQQYAVPVIVTNEGDETAELVEIVISLEAADKALEQTEFRIDYLPRGAQRRGTAIFSHDPRASGTLHAQVRGYQRP